MKSEGSVRDALRGGAESSSIINIDFFNVAVQ
jgi:hypothetical protein